MEETSASSDPSRVQQELQKLRSRHQVELLDDAEEGRSVERISRGKYGFTNAPGQERTPVFRKESFQSFEVHHLPDGAAHLVGFVSARHAALIAERSHNLEITLYPAPCGEATRLVSLLFDEILPSKRGPARMDGNYLAVRLL